MRLLKYTIFFFFISCTVKPKISEKSRCVVRYDSLFKEIDTTKLDIIRNTDSAANEVLDKKSKSGERGLFRFDDNGNLRYYAFLENDHNDTGFYIDYDSVGNRKRSTTTEVVQWTFLKRKDSILRFEFYLCAVDYNYDDIKIEAGKYINAKVKLFETDFLKLIGADVRFNSSDLDSNRKVYITGKKQNKCSKAVNDFIDSTIVPIDL